MVTITSSFLIRFIVACVLIGYAVFDSVNGETAVPKTSIYLTLTALVLLLVILKKRYESFVYMHPGAWYSVSWIVAIVSYVMLQKGGYVPVEHAFLLARLMSMVMITILFFVVSILVFPKKRQVAQVAYADLAIGSQRLLLIFAVISFAGAIVNWIGIGMPFAFDDLVRQQWLQEIPKITAITWYPFHLSFAAAFYAGWTLQHQIAFPSTERKKYTVSVILLSLTGLLWSVGTGGRQVTGFVMLYFLLGIAFNFALCQEKDAISIDNKYIKFKIIQIFVLVVIVFAVFASGTNAKRALQQKSMDDKPFAGTPVLSGVGYFILYMGGTLMTQQAYGMPERRNISDTGPVSINGLLDWGFSDFNLYKLFGIRKIDASDTNPERALAQYGLALASGTRNIYYDLEADFGYDVALIFVFFLVMISQVVFTRTAAITGNKNLIGFVLLVFLIMYWAYSQQLSLMMHGQLRWSVTSFLLWSIFNSRLIHNRTYLTRRLNS